MKFNFKVLAFAALSLLAIATTEAHAQTCNKNDLLACNEAVVDACRAQYPACTTRAQKFGPGLLPTDFVDSLAAACCTDTRTTAQQNQCLRGPRGRNLVRSVNQMRSSVRANLAKATLIDAFRGLKELQQEGCATGTIID